MTLKDRFLDYWHTDLAYEDYQYDLSIFEQLVYGLFGTIGLIIALLGLIVSCPLWAIPYIIYKSIKLRKETNNGIEHST